MIVHQRLFAIQLINYAFSNIAEILECFFSSYFQIYMRMNMNVMQEKRINLTQKIMMQANHFRMKNIFRLKNAEVNETHFTDSDNNNNNKSSTKPVVKRQIKNKY